MVKVGFENRDFENTHYANSDTKMGGMMPRLKNTAAFLIAVLAIAVFLPTEASAQTPVQIDIQYSVESPKLYVTGKTNLPAGTKVGVEIKRKGRLAAQDFQVFIASDGSFKSDGFTNRGQPIAGNVSIGVIVYRNRHWQEPQILTRLEEYNFSSEDNFEVSIDVDVSSSSKAVKNEQKREKQALAYLTKASKAAQNLSSELEHFRTEREFQRVGFAQCCKYARWLSDVQAMREDLRKREAELLPYFDVEYRWLSMGLGYLVQVGTDYATHSGRGTKFTRDIEPDLKKLLALKAPDF